ncbi:sce7726 family protein [Phyllobacterium ifriqiyense]|uniref:sce7726 family protein n=1 Tax=Phyllobacterium ifriqiyense TaxID=314238 RepID=UPI003392551F
MRDIDVRKALRREVLKRHEGESDTLVLHELGLRHGVARVDVAVVNGSLHGYEIKSDADTLERLPSQIDTYSLVLDKATLVVGERHAEKAIAILPRWWGIKIASEGPRGGVSLREEARGRMNPSVNPIAVAELLWRPEVATILRELGFPEKELRKPRAHLYRSLADAIPVDELRDITRAVLKRRENWRHQTPLG